jgi:hypothetical protein
MARLGKVLSWLAALGIIALAVWAFIKGVEKDPAVVGSVFTAVAGVIVVVVQRDRQKRQELESAHRKQMSPIYRQLVETVKDIDAFTSKPQEEQEAFFKDLATKLILYGPTPVVKAWNVWQRATALDSNSPATLIAWEGVLRAVRKDLGHDNSALQPGDLLRLFVAEDDHDDSRALWRAVRASRPT